MIQPYRQEGIMNKKVFIFIMVPVILFFSVFLIAGCGGGSSGGGGSTAMNLSMVVEAVTHRYADLGTTKEYLTGYGCSNSDISGLGTRTLTIPGNYDFSLARNTGYLIGNHYYVGSDLLDYGEIRDPHYESAQRQFSAGEITLPYGASVNGTYNGVLGEYKKEFTFEQSAFMYYLDEDNVTTGAGTGLLNVSGGDTITINGQNNDYHYYCVAYNNSLEDGSVEVIWASADIRRIDWVETDEYYSFLAYDCEPPAFGTVTFNVPAGVMYPGEDNITLRIYACNVPALNSDQNGDFYTLTVAKSVLEMTLSGQ